MTSGKKEILLVDGSGFIFRAYHALPPLTRPDGTPVGAVMGFCNMIYKLLTTHPDSYIAIIFDTRENFRNEIYADYKANRPPPPEDLVPQFPLIREASVAFGLPTLEKEGYEADDLIATYARLANESGMVATIVSSDKDLMQLVRDGVGLMDPMKQITIGREQVIEKFGVPPEQVVDVQSLCGDSVDNVPGVPGIGIKTAAQLIAEYGSLESLLDRTLEIKQPKRRQALEDNAELARISKKLVTLDWHVPVDEPIEKLVPTEPFSETLKHFLEQQGFRSLVARIPFGKSPANANANKADETPQAASAQIIQKDITQDYALIQDEQALVEWIKDAEETGALAFDTETTGLTPALAELVGISLATRAGRACYIPVGHGKKADLLGGMADQPKQLDVAIIRKHLDPLFKDPSILKIAHNAKYDMQMLDLAGFTEISPLDDTMLISYVVDGAAHPHGLDDMVLNFCGHKMISYDEVTGKGKSRISFAEVPLEQACGYAAEDADFTLRLHQIFKPRVAAEKMSVMYENIERPLVPVIARMEEAGIKVDRNVLRHLSQNFADRIVKLESEIQELAGHPFNVGSPKQLGVVLFDEMGLAGSSKTKTGDWSTSADILEKLAGEGHSIVEKVLDWRHLSKLRSTYTESLQESINPKNGRVHTSFAMALTNTGRLSSSDPNLQNIPIRTEEGRLIRTAFIAEEGWSLLSADYSQIELRLVAEMAGIEALKQAFISGEDIHARTASEVFGIPLSEITSEIRRKAKAINFGIIYGISGYGLAKQLDCPVSEAAAYIRTYMERFPQLGQFMEDLKAEARDKGYVKTKLGRKCVIAGINDKIPARRNFAERQAINAPLQGTAADLIKMAMIRIDRRIREEFLPMRLLLQVHDELILEIKQGHEDEMAALVKAEMEAVAAFSIPLVAETGIGKNWSEAH
ncbi:MAG: DNA polymerase I [Pseudobdellovibrionaceae bacterium]|jgi:DNA polymerase-1|nr:DNA polymerase I [Pseudobdellovibrionaceae bacterium]